MLIKHSSPNKSKRIGEGRQTLLDEGLEWQGNIFQTRPKDLTLINGRVSKLCALISLGEATLDDTVITSMDGKTLPLIWRSESNRDIPFTVREFLQFAIAVDEFIESKYQESWQNR
jgi:hypothetical protein